ncbi:hypothetical protein [Rhodopirellula europaea]|uniref:hypothetical protein n=1 Tax=Rhodopirellula europaea TaxID=1263866 RepID=UPI003D29D2FC
MITLSIFAPVDCLAQDIPLLYDVEYTGSEFSNPVLPEFDQLPPARPLPDSFAWSDGSGCSAEFKDLARRRSEIKAEIERYGVGTKPPRPEAIDANYNNATLTVKATEYGETLTLVPRMKSDRGAFYCLRRSAQSL